ncbi:MAG: hypothetical protein KC619_13610 [Myxococcales bacterium]|nr:hypothetical protein [Myxococcales bacterium]
MRMKSWFALVALLAGVSIAGCDPGGPPLRRDGGAGGDGGGTPGADSDGDNITDADEGRATDRDTDGDGTPDWMDDDSDNDGIPDIDEAGDDNPATPPLDSDADGNPNYIDDDSDGNGILDRDETPGDVDGDGTPNFADTDDDNDLINDVQELDGQLSPPRDADMDGIPDYQDRDSDGDTIMDGHERDADTDGDGIFDTNDLDSDDDGLSDAMEAGDTDLDTLPVDTDGDGAPDFRDTDSDNDGLSDHDEATVYGTSPTLEDTDGDGVSDLIEIAGGSDPLDMTDSPRTRGDFVFLVPYMEPPDPTEDTLMFRTNIAFADIYFLFDHSGSMGPETDALRGAVVDIMNDLQCADSGTACTRDSDCTSGTEICSPFTSTCIEDPSMSSCILSPYTGIGHYENQYYNEVSIQPDPAVTAAATWTITGGTEELYEAVIGVVNPGSSLSQANGCTGPNPGFIGCVDYRDSAVRILVAFTDEDSDGSITAAQAASELMANDVTFVGVWSATGTTGRSEITDLATASGSVDRTGAPLVFDGDGAGVVPAVVTAINEIVQGVPLRVTIQATDEPGDDGDSLQFIERLQTNTTDPGCSAVATEDTDGDGYDDAFPAVTPGTPVCWDVIPRQNDTVMPTAVPQIFEARLTVSGDGSPLDSRRVFFLIPPRIEGPGGPD